MTKGLCAGSRGEDGLSVVEALVGLMLALLVALAAYDFIDWGCRSFQEQSDQADAQALGRASLDLMSKDIRAAGYSPLVAPFDAVPAGTGTWIRVLSDRNRNGTVGTAGEPDENLTYRFVTSGDLFELRRGADLNGDGDYVDTGEREDLVATNVVTIDFDGDGSNEPFFAYDTAPPDTARVIVTFGIRAKHRDIMRREFQVTPFQSEIVLRNALDW